LPVKKTLLEISLFLLENSEKIMRKLGEWLVLQGWDRWDETAVIICCFRYNDQIERSP